MLTAADELNLDYEGLYLVVATPIIAFIFDV